MKKIILLDEFLSNKIAAGEVVERPSSVVKELVENAIDANSTIIEIEVEEAGLSKIRIIDNGDGIDEEDCLTAFQRHATSKIKDEHDLFRIRTLGFRGEALPSIASVSELEMKSSTGGNAGTHLILKGGVIVKHERSNSRKGTEITVSNLFFNTPARLKYLKTVHTELGNITDIVNRLAMSHPNISFRLSHNNKKMLFTNGNGDILQVIASIYGMGISKKMIPLTLNSLDFDISGYISLPEITRASRNYISTMINGRFVKNYSLVNAILRGYHTLLPIGRYPIIMLQISMDPLLVDVNVHPSKLEVRLSKEAELNDLIEEGIKNAFKQRQLIPESYKKEKKEKDESEQQHFAFVHEPTSSPISQQVVYENKDLLTQVEKKLVTVYPPVEKKQPIGENISAVFEKPEPVKEQVISTEAADIVSTEAHEVPSLERIPPLYPIGQMHGTYILAQNENGLYIIDQHAAQERLKYEYFKEQVGQVSGAMQELLIPITLEYSSSDYVVICSYLQVLSECGVILEPFGHNSFIVRSHPQWFIKGEEQNFIEEMIEQVLKMKKVDIKKLREEAAIMMSCKASIKANRHLRNDEIFALLEDLRKSSDPFTCPHGRPIIIHYSTYEMEKMFKRVM